MVIDYKIPRINSLSQTTQASTELFENISILFHILLENSLQISNDHLANPSSG